MSSGLDDTRDRNGVVTLTFNRPAKGNAYDQALLEALHAALQRYGADDGVRLVVLRGAGKHFCAGADITAAPSDAPTVSLVDVCRALDDLPQPTVAAVHGGCIGGGLAFAACCDTVIAAHDSVFALPEVRLGFAPLPLVPLLLRAIPERALRRWLVSGERFGAEEALRIGLVHALCDPADLDKTLMGAVNAFLQAAPQAARAAKRALRDYAGTARSDAELAPLYAALRQSQQSAEAREGRDAFRARRRPSWAPPAD